MTLISLGTWIESDSNKSNQEFAYGLQTCVNFSLSERLAMTVGAGYYKFDTQGKSSFLGDDDFFGNSLDPDSGTYLFDYHEIEGFMDKQKKTMQLGSKLCVKASRSRCRSGFVNRFCFW